jgi:gamma-glutamyl phosphate reductase
MSQSISHQTLTNIVLLACSVFDHPRAETKLSTLCKELGALADVTNRPDNEKQVALRARQLLAAIDEKEHETEWLRFLVDVFEFGTVAAKVIHINHMVAQHNRAYDRANQGGGYDGSI